MIRLNVFVPVKAEDRAAAVEVAKELVKKSLNDKGCIAYDVFESATRNNVIMICETWENEECLDAHMKSEHFTTLVPQIEKYGPLKLEKFNFVKE